ncbi:MAG: hypothetical protein WCR52_00775 [Bacteroidota bacterium]
MLREELFDAKIKSALERIEAPYEPATWSALEQKMSASDLLHSERQTNSFDQVFQKALTNLEAPFDQAHWEQMSIRIDRENRLRRRIWITKFAEAAIFLLLIVNIDGMMNDGQSNQPGRNRTQIQANEPVADSKINDHKSGKAHHSFDSDHKTAVSKVDVNSQGGFWAPLNRDSNPVETTASIENNVPLHEVNPLAINSLNASSANKSAEGMALSQSTANISVLDPLPILRAGQALSETFAFAGIPQSVKTQAPKQRNLYASLFISPVQDQIKNGAEYRKHNGLEGGVTVGYRKGKWGAESGLAYNKKSYQPKKDIEIYGGNVSNGYYGSYADQVSADVVSIPIRATRRIAKIGKSTVLAIAGATAHFAVLKEYRYKTIFYPGLSPQSDPGAAQNQPSLQKQGKGLLENGKFDDNFYATADAGLRIERPINHKMVAYIEPVVQTAFTGNGIGPSNSKINSVGFRAGVIASL